MSKPIPLKRFRRLLAIAKRVLRLVLLVLKLVKLLRELL